MVTKSAHEYVRFEDHPIVIDDLSQSSELLKHGINTAFDASELQQQKHAEIEAAMQKVSEILRDLERLNSILMKKAFEKTLEKRHPRPIIYREAKKAEARKKIKPEERDFLVRSEKALQNLQKNLEILKRQMR